MSMPSEILSRCLASPGDAMGWRSDAADTVMMDDCSGEPVAAGLGDRNGLLLPGRGIGVEALRGCWLRGGSSAAEESEVRSDRGCGARLG